MEPGNNNIDAPAPVVLPAIVVENLPQNLNPGLRFQYVQNLGQLEHLQANQVDIIMIPADEVMPLLPNAVGAEEIAEEGEQGGEEEQQDGEEDAPEPQEVEDELRVAHDIPQDYQSKGDRYDSCKNLMLASVHPGIDDFALCFKFGTPNGPSNVVSATVTNFTSAPKTRMEVLRVLGGYGPNKEPVSVFGNHADPKIYSSGGLNLSIALRDFIGPYDLAHNTFHVGYISKQEFIEVNGQRKYLDKFYEINPEPKGTFFPIEIGGNHRGPVILGVGFEDQKKRKSVAVKGHYKLFDVADDARPEAYNNPFGTKECFVKEEKKGTKYVYSFCVLLKNLCVLEFVHEDENSYWLDTRDMRRYLPGPDQSFVLQEQQQ